MIHAPVQAPEPPAELDKDLDAPASVVSEYIVPAPARHLPHMLLATTFVALLPLAVSLALRATGVLPSGWASVGLAVALSLAASTAGSVYWRKRDGQSEVLFSELLLWGWIRRWRQERELANATRLLDLVSPGGVEIKLPGAVVDETLSVQRREHLLRQLAGALEGQDIYLNGHSRRVARHATMIARGLGLSNEDVARVRVAAAVHDVGKLRTPKAILNKPGRLTDAEFEVIKRHPVDGAEMVSALGDAELTRIVRHHHERLDGAGYPDRLTGEDIPLGARIIAVADTFDAITSARPYREAAPHQRAIDILRQEAGAQLDPDAVRAFLAYYSGNRPMVVWAIITSSIRRVVAWLTGDPAAAATISASKLAAATAATAAIGAAAGAAPVPVLHHMAPARAVAQQSRPVSRGLTLVVHHPTGTAHGAPTEPVPGAQTPARPASTKTRRGGAHRAHAGRPAAPRRVRRRNKHRTPETALSAVSRTRALPARSGMGNPAPPVASRPTTPPAATAPAPHPAPPAHPVPPAHPAPPSHPAQSQGHAYAYGRTGAHGNSGGHGNGHATTSAPSPPAAAAPSATGNSQAGATAHGASHGNGDAHASAGASAGAAPAEANPAAQTVAAPPAGASQPSAGHGQGNSH